MNTALLLILILGIPALAGEGRSHLPHREALATEIKFWKKIFSEISLNQYLIHDSQNLGIIYKTVALDTTLARRQRDKVLQAVKDEIKSLLLKLHSGEFEAAALAPWERQVYEQFAALAEQDKFLQAAERIRAQQGIRENFLAGVKRSFAYLPHIETVFKQEGLPHELIYLPHVESSFNPEAMSHVGAAGMWQFMRGTARLYMKIDRVTDERFDPLVSTRSAARLLKYNYRELKDWALAITAYNHGLGSMRKAKREHGDYMTIRENYLRRSFGFASKNFYPEFLAVVDIADSITYYFPEIEKSLPLEFQEIQLPRPVTLTWFSNAYRIPAEELRRLNPGYRKPVWSGEMPVPSGYRLRLPLQADAYRILASLGAEKEKLGDILVAQMSLDRQQLIITSFNELQARRKTMSDQLAASHAGVESAAAPQPAFAAGELLPALQQEEISPFWDFPVGVSALAAGQDASRTPTAGKPGVESPGAGAAAPKETPAGRVSPLPDEGALASAGTISGSLESLAGEALSTAIDLGRLKPGIAVAPAAANPQAFLLAAETAVTEPLQENLPIAASARPPAVYPQSLAAVKPLSPVAFSKPAAQGEPPVGNATFSGEFAFFVPGDLAEAGEMRPKMFANFDARSQSAKRVPVLTKTGVEEQRIAPSNTGQPIALAEASLQTAPPMAGGVRLPGVALAFSKSGAGMPAAAPAAAGWRFELFHTASAQALPSLAGVGGPAAAGEGDLAAAPSSQAPGGETVYPATLKPAKPGVEETFPAALSGTNGRFFRLEWKQQRLDTLWAGGVLHRGLSALKPGVEEGNERFAGPQTAAQFSQEIASAGSGTGYAGSWGQGDLGWSFAAGSDLLAAGVADSPEFLSSPEITAILKRRLNPEQDMIRVFPQETLGHISEWLNVSISQLRRMNKLSGREKLYTGQPLKMDFTRVTPAQFLEKRLRYHLSLIALYTKEGGQIKLEDYAIRSGENLWSLAHKRYKFPVNLLLYFNDFDKLERLYPGDVIKLPILYH